MERKRKNLSILLTLGLFATFLVTGASAQVDCRSTGEGEICDAETILGQTTILVSLGDVGARSFNVLTGLPQAPDAYTDPKDTTASTGLAEEVDIHTETAWSAYLDDQRNDRDDPSMGFDSSWFWVDYQQDGTEEAGGDFDCTLCTGEWGLYKNSASVMYHDTGYVPTGFPSGSTYTWDIGSQIVRWWDENGNFQYDGGSEKIASDSAESPAHVTVGDFL